MYAKDCICCSSISLQCGDDYLEADGRALAFQGDNWPDTVTSVRLIFESSAGCGCTKKCSVSIDGTLFDAGQKPGFGAADVYTSAAGSVTPFVYQTAWFDIPAAKASKVAGLNGWRLVGITSAGSVITLQEGAVV
jgi:hypothetical protein